jgi:hypothetical protein
LDDFIVERQVHPFSFFDEIDYIGAGRRTEGIHKHGYLWLNDEDRPVGALALGG